MMRDEADDAFAIGGAQPGAAIRDALAEPVDPEAAVRIEHDLDDLRVGKPTGDRRSECGLQHARAAISRFEPDRFCCHGRTPFRGAGPECPCDGAAKETQGSPQFNNLLMASQRGVARQPMPYAPSATTNLTEE